MAQHDFLIDNASGAVVRADINSVLEAIASNNSGATEPPAIFANMWWFDTSTNLLKQRDNGNTEWLTIASKDGSGWTPYRQGVAIGDGATLVKDTDGALTANSDSNVATQKAVKTYADGKISKTTAGEINAMTEKTTPADEDVVVIEDSEASYAKKKMKMSSIGGGGAGGYSNMQAFTSNGTWIRPAGVDRVYVKVQGGGGGGGGGIYGAVPGAGGAGGYSEAVVAVTGNVTVVVGAGGNGTTTSGNNGGQSYFNASGANVRATGGGGGTYIAGDGGVGGAGGLGSNGNLNLYGGNGGDGGNKSLTSPAGGSSVFGGAGQSVIPSSDNPKNGKSASPNTGSGGGAGSAPSNVSAVGGNGASGIVIVYWNE